MDRIDDVAHVRDDRKLDGLDAVVLVETGWCLTGGGESGVWNSSDVYRVYSAVQSLPQTPRMGLSSPNLCLFAAEIATTSFNSFGATSQHHG
jgi:hypothetical protein